MAEVDLLEEVKRLRRSVRILGTTLVGMAVIGLLTAASSQSADADIRARSLTIVDGKGIARVVIGAPVPDAMVGGKKLPRAGAASGIILNGPDGNERGGYLVTDQGDEGVLTLDDLGGNEVFKVVANADAGASLFLQHKAGAMLALSTYRGEPEVQLIHKDGKRLHAIPESAPIIR